MIVIAIIAILLTLATPAFRNFSLRSQRTIAITELLQVAACQERMRAAAGMYNTATCLPSPNQYYRYQYQAPGLSSANSFKVIAMPIQGQLKDSCGALMLDQGGYREVGNNNADVGKCWSSR